ARYEAGRALAQQLGDPVLEARFLNGIANVYFRRGDNRTAAGFAEQTYQSARGRDPYWEAAGLALLAHSHTALGRFQDALECFERALELLRSIGAKHTVAGLLHNRSLLYLSLREYGKVLQSETEAAPILHAQGDRSGEGLAADNAANALLELGQADAALERY